ncbi:hypothetical protein E2C01_099963 [Portunus trituberculatus]|uniref:Uncharacterized protein n=1 Tax=Portunus trituberculatus TaxID=210409 RepID=A0A5B7KC34_PORTR|nr:hypothetical protein [Portunus trituberculatus]
MKKASVSPAAFVTLECQVKTVPPLPPRPPLPPCPGPSHLPPPGLHPLWRRKELKLNTAHHSVNTTRQGHWSTKAA